MYIRTISRKNKNGSVVRYVSLAHNEWDPVKQCSVAKAIVHLGREEDVDMEGLRRLAKSINRFLGPEDQIRNEVGHQDIRFLSSRPVGGAWLLDGLWKRLGIDNALEQALQHRELTMPVERALFAMVCNRALAPESKFGVIDWVNEQRVLIPGLERLEHQTPYRSMDLLYEHLPTLQEEVYWQIVNLLRLEVDLIYFDTTSTYLEIEEEDDFRRYGHSKDHRPDLPQVVIGLAVTRDGIPVRCWCWPGNTSDMSVAEEVKNDLCDWKLGRVISVMDRVFSGEENLRMLQRGGGHYIVGEKLRSGKVDTEKALSTPGRFKVLTENMEVKEVTIGDGEARKRYVLVRNPLQAAKDKETREHHLQSIQDELAAIGELNGKPHSKRVCALLAHRTLGRYLKTDEQGQPLLDKAKIKAEERLDGKYLMRCSDDTLSAADVAFGYKQLLEVEDAFRILKQTMELRPIYHRLEERIRAHVALCWLALLLVRIAEMESGKSWRDIRRLMEKIQVIDYETPIGIFTQRTELDAVQKGIFNDLKVELPPSIFFQQPKNA